MAHKPPADSTPPEATIWFEPLTTLKPFKLDNLAQLLHDPGRLANFIQARLDAVFEHAANQKAAQSQRATETEFKRKLSIINTNQRLALTKLYEELTVLNLWLQEIDTNAQATELYLKRTLAEEKHIREVNNFIISRPPAAVDNTKPDKRDKVEDRLPPSLIKLYYKLLSLRNFYKKLRADITSVRALKKSLNAQQQALGASIAALEGHVNLSPMRRQAHTILTDIQSAMLPVASVEAFYQRVNELSRSVNAHQQQVQGLTKFALKYGNQTPQAVQSRFTELSVNLAQDPVLRPDQPTVELLRFRAQAVLLRSLEQQLTRAMAISFDVQNTDDLPYLKVHELDTLRDTIRKTTESFKRSGQASIAELTPKKVQFGWDQGASLARIVDTATSTWTAFALMRP